MGIVETILGLCVICICSLIIMRIKRNTLGKLETLKLLKKINFKQTPVFRYRIIGVYPHDRKAYTQGLFFDNGFFFESTGLYGKSTIRKVDMEKGIVVRSCHLTMDVFGEGLTLLRDRLIQLTWKSHKAYIYDVVNLKLICSYEYPYEGWGITHDNENLIVSDGTHTLRYLNPDTFEHVRSLEVTFAQSHLSLLNDLEFIKGEIWANVWKTNLIARISPETGKVNSWVNLSELLSVWDRLRTIRELNGIAYDRKKDRLFVTGKFWPKIYHLEITD